MRNLKLPVTITPADHSDVPGNSDLSNSIEKGKKAKIIEGYTIQYSEPINNYKFSAEINVDADKLFDLVKESVINFEYDEVALIYHHSDDDPKYGRYVDKFELINFLEKYSYELINDAFLEFGVIYNAKDFLEEIFISKYKYIQYWGTNEPLFRQTLLKYDLFEIPDLEFIDFYPVVRRVLTNYDSSVIETNEIVKILEEKFGNKQLF